MSIEKAIQTAILYSIVPHWKIAVIHYKCWDEFPINGESSFALACKYEFFFKIEICSLISQMTINVIFNTVADNESF